MRKQPENSKNTSTLCFIKMAEVDLKERFLGSGIRGKLGKAYECGEAVCGEAICGEEEVAVPVGEGLEGEHWGVYQKIKANGRVLYIKRDFDTSADPNSAGQQTQRNKFSAGMIAWGNLTAEQKKSYNKKGSKLGLPGQNVFMKEYLNSH